MTIVAFSQWWYGRGWAWQFRYAMGNPARIGRSFDLLMLTKTLFTPWKRVSTTTNQGSFVQQKMSQLTDALVARFIGFLIRSTVIIVGLFALTIGSVFQLLIAVAWPLLPFAPIVFIALGVWW
jgi:hypothetical protein